MAAENDRRVDYVEFGATDIQATRAFYEAIFGWKFEDYGPDYTSFQDGRLAGGFDRDRPGSRGGVLVVIYAEDLEAIEARVRAMGGEVVTPTYSFPGGRRFHFLDPSGNELAVWTDRPGT